MYLAGRKYPLTAWQGLIEHVCQVSVYIYNIYIYIYISGGKKISVDSLAGAHRTRVPSFSL